MAFNKIDPTAISENIFKLIGNDWMLITAGDIKNYNTMTASWGGVGVLWGKNICWCVVRPQRYTYEFMEKNNKFTLSFFTEKYRDALNLCGSKSGRDIDKAKAAGITPVCGLTENCTVFKEASLILECRKLYFQDLDPQNFLAEEINSCYPGKDYHRMYIGEILSAAKKDV